MKKNSKQKTLFQEAEQQELDLSTKPENEGPVECLGMTFENDEKRREHFLAILREKLKDPEFRKIEGFPIGEDEDILALSDPPYYTACPNPFIEDFIKHYGKPYDPNEEYKREPFASDVSDGKNDPIYTAHPYHTKVPFKAIMRYLLHYTNPGDLIIDGFCGTGMAGIASQMCSNSSYITEIGYKLDDDGSIRTKDDAIISKLGARKAMLTDISTAATFISYNYNKKIDYDTFLIEAKNILRDVEKDFGWMYITKHSDKKSLGNINFMVWSDVFICPNCSSEVIYWDSAVDLNKKEVHDVFLCKACSANVSKRNAKRAEETIYDNIIGTTIVQSKQVPVLINYSFDGKRYEKKPDNEDLEKIKKIKSVKPSSWVPNVEMPHGFNTDQPKKSHGLTHVHHFYTYRNLLILSKVWEKLRTKNQNFLFWFSSTLSWVGKENRLHLGNYFNKGGGVITSLRGTWYVASLSVETNVLKRFELRLRAQKFRNELYINNIFVNTSSVSNLQCGSNVCDYIFTDPPFGGNIMYSELNFVLEAWLKVFTNTNEEAIESKAQNKDIFSYQKLMSACFKEYFRVLKPGRWITVEFHNSKNAVWNVIQEAMQISGFVIADIRTLDKGKGSFKQVTSASAVKKDLIISAYKPNNNLEYKFNLNAGTEKGAWEFLDTHLKQLPIFIHNTDNVEVITERQNFLLYDRMVAFHVQHGVTVPISSAEFYLGLQQRYPERDGMYFLPEQVAEYDKKRMKVKDVLQLNIFISDESTAIEWLRQQLLKKPQTFQEIHFQFLRELGGWKKNEKPLELMELLQYNFIRYDGKGDVPSQIHSYLSTNYKDLRKLVKDDPVLQAKAKDKWYVPDPNKAGDLEKLREKALLKEFEVYRQVKQKRLKVFRLEAMRAGFKKAWQEADYDTIISVAEKIPENVLQEDQKLLMWYDQAITRRGE